jgi:hypothetical protein
MCPEVPEDIVLSKKTHQIISILDLGECFHEREKLATEVEHSESQYQQGNSLHCYGGVNREAIDILLRSIYVLKP